MQLSLVQSVPLSKHCNANKSANLQSTSFTLTWTVTVWSWRFKVI